jgi:phosphatidylglycerol:prolipoprotein diacylglycerol transferase
MLALSFFVGIWFASRRAERRGLKQEIVYDLSIVLIIAAVVGSRVLYILTHRDHYRSLLDIIALWQGGATLYGGLILAVAGAAAFLRLKGIPFFRMADICAPSIALGVFFTRIGCYLSGCCFGRPTECVTGLVFPAGSPAGYTFADIPVHPTQLYASLYGLLIFLALLLLEKKHSFEGYTFGFLCILYGAARFIVDFFRYYEDSAMWGPLTASQVLSLGLVVVGAAMFVIMPALNRRASRRE